MFMCRIQKAWIWRSRG